MAKNKYTVVDYKSGGFFIHGGLMGEIYIKDKYDADTICAALNMVERLKMKATMRRVDEALSSLEDLSAALKAEGS